MKILFLHGWQSTPGGLKPTFLKEQGHSVLNPILSDDDFDEAVRVAQAELDQHQPDVIVGSSRGGAVAINTNHGDIPLVLLCPAWKKWGTKTKVPPNTTILHSRADDRVPFADSEDLVRNSGLQSEALIDVGAEHRLADADCLKALVEACERATSAPEVVDVTVYYLEMLAHAQRFVPPPRDGLTILHVQSPSVPYYRFLYNAVGGEYYWLCRRKLADAELGAVIQEPRNELHVLHVDGSPAGFAELDRRKPDDIELVQFGLMADFIGQGLGKWFLQSIIDKVWSYQPRRFWLHTCTLDHPAAVPMYAGAGFVQFKEEAIRREL